MKTRTEALALLKEYNSEDHLLKHAYAVEAVMRRFAREFGEDEEYWGIVGLLHDLDYEKWPDQHCIKTGELLRENGFEEDSADGYIVPDAAKTFFMKEQWDVFSGVKLAWDSTVATFAETPTAVKDAEGNIRIPAGAGIPTDETLSGMDWWMQGVTVIEN